VSKDKGVQLDGQSCTHVPTIVEVALNGPWGKTRQPLAPIAVADIVADGVACARAGASVVHVHPYDERTGRQNDDLETYVRIIEGIREQVDVLVYPSAPFVDNDDINRYGVTERLAERGLIQWATVDPGSLNIARHDDIAQSRPGFVYRNSEAALNEALAMASRWGIVPSYACYEPGHIRLGAALHAMHLNAPTPVYRLMLSDEFTFGFPPRGYALEAYAALFSDLDLKAPVMVAGLGVDITHLIPDIVQRGWHLRVGLEDAAFGCPASNVDLVRRSVDLVHGMGGRVAKAEEVLQGSIQTTYR
jgi:3-keto-5-aminohexanoate cleavage enzyme